jgi:uncharacterized protein YdcH (DUF465 family)
MLVRLLQIAILGSAFLALPVCAESGGLNEMVSLRSVSDTSGKSVRSSYARALSDLRSENSSLKEQQQVLIDYAKQLRTRHKELENKCLQSGKKQETTGGSNKKDCKESGLFVPVSEYNALKRKYEETQNRANSSTSDMQDVAKKLSENEKNTIDLTSQLTKVENEFEEYKKNKEAELHELTLKNTKLYTELEDTKAELDDYIRQLENNQKAASRLPALEKELLSLKNELLLRKTAEEILLPGSTARKEPVPERSDAPKRERQAAASDKKIFSDVTVLEVTGNKVSLRVGPGTQHSPVMDVQKGTKLTVEAKENDWYRVLTSTGSRAFIHSNYSRIVSGSAESVNKAKARAQLDVEPHKPPLPAKPVRRAGGTIEPEESADAIEIPVGGSPSEKLAIEKLMRAMSGMGEKEGNK